MIPSQAMNRNLSFRIRARAVFASAHTGWLILRRLGWRLIVTFLLFTILALLSLHWGYSADAATRQQSSGNPLVLAFYYTWFDENTWREDQVPDFPVERYVSRDRGVMGRHIEQAQRAGIDALMVAWYGPGGQWNQTEPNLAAMLDEANARAFKLGILFETNSPFFSGVGDATEALRHALNVHANHPAYLRVDGKPVIFFWRTQQWGVETWRNIRNQVDPGRNAIWIADGVDTAYLAVFDGHHLYSNTWNPPSDLNTTNQKFARLVNQARQAYGVYKYWVATVMPGYDDTRTGRGNAFARSREGGAYYARSWQAAMDSRPDWIVITSFNEWPEGSYIEPSVAYGDLYLNLTTQWSGQFKAGGGVTPTLPPAPAAATAAIVSAPAPTAPLPDPDKPTAYVTATLLNLRSGPGTDYAILARMPQNSVLAITGSNSSASNWWQVSYNGQIGWVSADFVRTAGPINQVPSVALPATPTVSIAPTTVVVTNTSTTTSSSLIYDLLLGDKADLIDDARRSVLLDKWRESATSN
ncbi:SH3 domain-containing protein [bacterium]|nr:SH3 domain-containing protein [bacterium]